MTPYQLLQQQTGRNDQCMLACLPRCPHKLCSRRSGLAALSLSDTVLGRRVSLLSCMESNTNNISSAGLHGLDQRQHRSETFEAVDMRQGQNALGSCRYLPV